MRPSVISLLRLAAKSLCLAFASMALPGIAAAGLVNGVQTVNGLTVYLGVVPAAVTRAHAQGHAERTMHGGVAKPGLHDVHLLVAVFNQSSGERLKNVAVTARLHGTGNNRWSVPLSPMTINGSLTYGGYTSLGREENLMISIDVKRSGRTPHTSTDTAQFEYVHN